MRKIVIIFCMILWFAAGATVIYRQSTTKKEGQYVVSAFGTNTFSEVNARVSGFGKCNYLGASIADKESVLKKMARSLRIDKYNIEFKKEEQRVTGQLYQEGAYGNVLIKIVTLEDDCETSDSFVFVELDLKNNLDSAIAYKEKVEEIYKELGMESDITVICEGIAKGYLDYASKNVMLDSFMKKINADIVSESRQPELFLAYGYTESLEDYISISGQKINVSVSIEYDEVLDETIVRMATPVETFNR